MFFYYYIVNKGTSNYILSVGIILAFLSGFIDDLIHIKARYKLILQIVAAFLAAYSGLLITNIRIYTFFNLEFGIFSYAVTIIWIVAFMNAVNLIDGMDGLSTGIVLVANLFIISISYMQNNYTVLTLAVILEFSILGFYLFNFPPAKIFLGDGGAYFIGFIYAVMPLMGIKKSSALTVFLIPMILMLIPISDIAMVIFRRIRARHNVFRADRNHLHHRLMNLGFSNKGILAVVYSFTSILGFFSLLMVAGKPELTLFMLIFITGFVGFLFFILHRAEKRIELLKNEDKGELVQPQSSVESKSLLHLVKKKAVS